MARPLIAPLVAVLSAGLLAYAGLETETFRLPPHNACAFGLARLDAAPADVLFLGSSRFGAAIDPGYIDRHIDVLLGRSLKVERLALTENNIPDFRIISEEYLRMRGAPAVLVLQLMYEFNAAKYAEIGRPIHSERNLAYGSFEQLYRMQAGMPLNPKPARLPLQFERGFRTMPAVFLDHIVTGIKSAIRWPGYRLLGITRGCVGGKNQLQRQSNVWPYDDVDNRKETANLDSPERLEVDFSATDAMLSMMPDSPHRRYENAQFADLIATWHASGTRIYISYIPGLFEKPISKDSWDILATAFPDATYLALDGFLQLVTTKEPFAYYRDEGHVNIDGTAVISREFTRLLVEAIDD